MPEALSRPQRSVAHVHDDWDARGEMIGSATALVTAEGIARADCRGWPTPTTPRRGSPRRAPRSPPRSGREAIALR